MFFIDVLLLLSLRYSIFYKYDILIFLSLIEIVTYIAMFYYLFLFSIIGLAPSFAKKPLEPEKYAAEGMNATIECNPEAVPRPEFIWRKNGNVIGRGKSCTAFKVQ